MEDQEADRQTALTALEVLGGFMAEVDRRRGWRSRSPADTSVRVSMAVGRAAGAQQELDESGSALTLGGLPGAKEEAKGSPKGAAAEARGPAGAAAAAAAAGGSLGGAR